MDRSTSTIGTRRASNASATHPQLEEMYDVLYQNERGSGIWGKPKFSSRSLLPTDFPAWSDENGKFEMNKEGFQCPPGWEYVSEWLIDLKGEVDQDGWHYGFAFSSKKWTSSCTMTSYVRRRRWLRIRRRKVGSRASPITSSYMLPEDLDVSPTSPHEIDKAHVSMRTAILQLKESRLDREKLLVLQQLLQTKGFVKEMNAEDGSVNNILAQFDYEGSRAQALTFLVPHLSKQTQVLPPIMKSMKYFSDRKMIALEFSLDISCL